MKNNLTKPQNERDGPGTFLSHLPLAHNFGCESVQPLLTVKLKRGHNSLASEMQLSPSGVCRGDAATLCTGRRRPSHARSVGPELRKRVSEGQSTWWRSRRGPEKGWCLFWS